MKIEFELKDFENEKSWLINILGSLKRKKRFQRTRQSDEFFVTTPALSYKYVESLVSEIKDYDPNNGRIYKKIKLDSDLEKVFCKNAKYGLKYLIVTGQKKFEDKCTSKKFFDKLYKNPFLCFIYSFKILKGKRIPAEKEEVFLKDYNALYQYAKQIIKGRFDKRLHDKIIMISFSEEAKKRHDYQYLESYIQNIDNVKNFQNVSSYYGMYF